MIEDIKTRFTRGLSFFSKERNLKPLPLRLRVRCLRDGEWPYGIPDLDGFKF
jgi:hypothetical protein